MEFIIPSFRFAVTLRRTAGNGAGETLGSGAFQDVTGLEIEMEMADYPEGGRNNGIVRRPGRAKFPMLILKRGMFFEAADPAAAATSQAKANMDLWKWIQGVINGERPIARYDGTIQVMSADDTVRATWTFERGLPAKVKGPDLNGKTGEIAIEELHIAHEGLQLQLSGGGA